MEKLISSFINFWLSFVDFSGKTNRSDFWWTILANVIVSIVLGIVTSIFVFIPILGGIVLFIAGIYGVACVIPSLAMNIRRLNDLGKSPLLILVALIPLVGALYLLYLYLQPGMTENV